METIPVGLIASLTIGLSMGIGAIPILFANKFFFEWSDMLLGLGAGMMLAETGFSLIVPGLEAAGNLGHSNHNFLAIFAVIMIWGAILLGIVRRYFQEEHFYQSAERVTNRNFQQNLLFILAIFLHNFPEGLAVGIGFEGINLNDASVLFTGISLEHMPEGLIIAQAILSLGYSKVIALGFSFLTGLIEPMGGIIGAVIISYTQLLLPWGMALAAGAIIFIVIGKIIPYSIDKASARVASFGLTIGFVVMILFDTALS